MSELRFATFGCWNEGCKPDSVQKQVVELLKERECEYKFLVILGDNYYSEKKKLEIKDLDNPLNPNPVTIKYNDLNLEEMKNGFDCLSSLTIPKKMILGNHDIDEGTYQGCSNMRSQLRLPWYDIKFPYDYEDHFLFINKEQEISLRSYKMIKFIYLDTSVYTDTSKNSCYERVINKTPEQIIIEQRVFIDKQLKSLNKKITNTVVIFGHEPLITFRFKANEDGVEKPLKELSLLNDLYDLTKNMHADYQFNYICADFHNFEEAAIVKPYYDGEEFKIHQLVFGTGGKTDLDKRFNPLKLKRLDRINGFSYNMIHRYGSDQPILDYSVNPLHLNGYGEIIIDTTGLKYNFISVEPREKVRKEKKKDKEGKKEKTPQPLGIEEWGIKYLKYKNKYLSLKNKN